MYFLKPLKSFTDKSSTKYAFRLLASRTFIRPIRGPGGESRPLRYYGANANSDFTPVFNAAGTPAMSIPLNWSANGLPVGSQFAARVGAEATLFGLAYQLEAARPWADRWAPHSYPVVAP